MANRTARKSGKNRRQQTSKDIKHEDKAWMRARLDQHNRNLRVPSGKAYKRPSPGSDW